MQISAQLVKELRQRSGVGMMECKKALVANDGNVEAAMEWLRKHGLAKAEKRSARTAAEGRIVGAHDKDRAVLVEVNCETDFVAKDKSFLAFTDKVAGIALESGSQNVDDLQAAAYSDEEGSVADVAKALVAKIGEKIEVRRMARVDDAGTLGYYIHGGRIGVIVALEGGDEELAKGIAMHVAAMNPLYISADDVPAETLEKEKEIARGQVSEKDKSKPAEIIDKIITGKVHKTIAAMTLTGQPYVMDTSATVGDILKKANASVVRIIRLAVGEGIEKKDDDFAAEVMKQAGLA